MARPKHPERPCRTCRHWKLKALDMGECPYHGQVKTKRDFPKLVYGWDDGSIYGIPCKFYDPKVVD